MNNNIDVKVFQQKTNLDDYLGYKNQATTTGNAGEIRSDLDSVFALWDQPVNSNNNGAFANINNVFAEPPRLETYGGFQFKGTNEKSAVDQTLSQLRQAQAANPGKAMSKTVKVGKYKLTITLKEDGTVSIKRKKKRGGLFGGLFKKIGGFLKKALPIISMVAMFVPGLQPLALASRIAGGFMGVIDSIKSGNIFGAITNAVGAFSGIGGKVSGIFSNISTKASGFVNSITGGATSWFSNAFKSASNLFSSVKTSWSNITGGVGTRVSDFLFKNGSNVFGKSMNNSATNLLKNFADSIGSRAVDLLNQTANNFLGRLMNSNPLGQRIGGFLSSGFGQTLMEYLRGRQI